MNPHIHKQSIQLLSFCIDLFGIHKGHYNISFVQFSHISSSENQLGA